MDQLAGVGASGARAPNPVMAAAAAQVLMPVMAAEGVDLSNPSAVLQWTQDFYIRASDENGVVSSDAVIAAADAVRSVAVDVPEDGTARAAAVGSPLVEQIAGLVGFLREGRKLTRTGNLTIADARQLVERLDTGDQLGDAHRPMRLRSSADLSGLRPIVALAVGSGFVERARGRLAPTAAGRALGTDPLADLRRLVEGIDHVGMVSARLSTKGYESLAVHEFFDRQLVPIAHLLLTEGGSGHVRFALLVQRAYLQFEQAVVLDAPSMRHPLDRLEFVQDVLLIAVRTLEMAGLALVLNPTPDVDPVLGPATVTLTPAGRWALYHHLVETHRVPLQKLAPPELTALDFESLMKECRSGAPGSLRRVTRETAAWIDHRGDRALPELIATIRATTDLLIQNYTLSVITQNFPDDAEATARELLADRRTQAAALYWFMFFRPELDIAVTDFDPAVVLDLLVLTLAIIGPDEMTGVFDRASDTHDQLMLIELLRRQLSPSAGIVLDALGHHHPEPNVAATARKAAFQCASRFN